MALFDSSGKVGNRRPSFRGKVMFDVVNGQIRARAWPKKRGAKKHPHTVQQNDWFYQAQFATKYWPVCMVEPILNATEGTPFLPRDIMTMIMAGRFAMLFDDTGRKVHSMAMVTDVSDSLDVIGQRPGDLLFRGNPYWDRLPIGAAGQVLGSDGVRPIWQQGGSGGGTANWWFQPPATADFPELLSGDGLPCIVADDADIGLTYNFGENTGTGAFRGAFKPLPDADWSIETRLVADMPEKNYLSFGVGALNEANGKLITACMFADTGSRTQARNCTIQGGYSGDVKRPFTNTLFVSIARSGADLICRASVDGKLWADWWKGSWSTEFQGAPTHVGILGSCTYKFIDQPTQGSVAYWKQTGF